MDKPLTIVEEEEVAEANEGVLLWPEPLLALLLLMEESDEAWEKRDKAPQVGGGVVAPPKHGMTKISFAILQFST